MPRKGGDRPTFEALKLPANVADWTDDDQRRFFRWAADDPEIFRALIGVGMAPLEVNRFLETMNTWFQTRYLRREFDRTVRAGDWDVTLSLAVGEDGVTCYRLLVEPANSFGIRDPSRAPRSGITSRVLRGIPIGDLIRSEAAALRNRPDEIGEAARAYIPPQPGARPGRKGWGDEHYEWIAREYLEALAEDPRRPVKRLTERLGAGHSEATVRDWVNEARSRDFLTSPGHGRTGGGPGPRMPYIRTAWGRFTRKEVEDFRRQYAEAAAPIGEEIDEAKAVYLIEMGVSLDEFRDRIRRVLDGTWIKEGRTE